MTSEQIKIMRIDWKDQTPLPEISTTGAAAMGIAIPDDVYLCEGENVRVPLGFATALPAGYVALLLPRSGVATRYGLDLVNSVGIIDCDDRSEWVAWLRLKSTGDATREVVLPKHSRPLQALLLPVERMTTCVVASLPSVKRSRYL